MKHALHLFYRSLNIEIRLFFTCAVDLRYVPGEVTFGTCKAESDVDLFYRPHIIVLRLVFVFVAADLRYMPDGVTFDKPSDKE